MEFTWHGKVNLANLCFILKFKMPLRNTSKLILTIIIFNYYVLLLQACTGKFSPIFQWLYFDSLESLKEGDIELPEAEVKPCGSRYDGQTAVFGREYQKQLENLKYFLVILSVYFCYYYYVFHIVCNELVRLFAWVYGFLL